MKKCTKCNKIKPLDEFHNHRTHKDGKTSSCKSCISAIKKSDYAEGSPRRAKILAAAKEYREKNKDKVAETKRKCAAKKKDEYTDKRAKYYQANITKIKEYNKLLYESRKEEYIAKCKEWRVLNPEKVRSYNAKRRADIYNRVPKWLTEEDYEIMQWAYDEAIAKTNKYGVKFHVDHIIPLRGKTVSGFHCPENLQVITADENLHKSNKFESSEWCAEALKLKDSNKYSPGSLYREMVK